PGSDDGHRGPVAELGQALGRGRCEEERRRVAEITELSRVQRLVATYRVQSGRLELRERARGLKALEQPERRALQGAPDRFHQLLVRDREERDRAPPLRQLGGDAEPQQADPSRPSVPT